jgi:CRISPR-associated protein Cas5d
MFGIRLKVAGDYACFTRPELKTERVSYDVMTPSAARGVLEAIHWKPAISWVIDAIHVLTPVRFANLRRNEVGAKISARNVAAAMARGSVETLRLNVDEDRQQRAAVVLVKPAYVISAHFELTARAGPEDNVGKHLDMFNRRAARGQCFHQPCLGAREFAADFELLAPEAPSPAPEPSPSLGFGAPRDLGLMLWDIDHAAPGRPSMFFRARLEEGAMRVPPPGSAEILR